MRLRRGPLTIRQSIQLMERITSALAVAHDRGIVHRDIKPNNLFLRGSQLEGVTLLDFGVARHGITGRMMTQTGTVVGTPEYMSPSKPAVVATSRPLPTSFRWAACCTSV